MRGFVYALVLSLTPVAAQADFYAILVEGLGGLPRYSEAFDTQVIRLEQALESAGGIGDVLSISGDEARREVLEQFFAKLSAELSTDDRIAVFLVGHGSYDGSVYKFNIPGPDITGEDIRELMDGLPASRQLLVVTGSSSGALIDVMKSDTRTVITATRSGAERNAPHFGDWFTEALENESADLNKNEYVSVQEAYDYAARAVEEHFESAGQLATEHSQISGDSAVQFNLARLVPPEPVDPGSEAADLVSDREVLDERIQDLQLRRSEMDTEEYYAEIEVLMLELARLEEEIEGESGEDEDSSTAGDIVDTVEEVQEEGQEEAEIQDLVGPGIEVGTGLSIGEEFEIHGVDILEEGDAGEDDSPDSGIEAIGPLDYWDDDG